jgi:hypothetical protein
VIERRDFGQSKRALRATPDVLSRRSGLPFAYVVIA